MEIHCCCCPHTNQWQQQQRWVAGETKQPSNSQGMQNLNDSLRLGLVRTMMRLFGKSCFIQPGESWKNPLSFHPTHNESCIYTTPRRPCTDGPRQTGPSQTEGDSSEEQKQGCSFNQSPPLWARPSLILSLGYGPLSWRCCQTIVCVRVSESPSVCLSASLIFIQV